MTRHFLRGGGSTGFVGGGGWRLKRWGTRIGALVMTGGALVGGGRVGAGGGVTGAAGAGTPHGTPGRHFFFIGSPADKARDGAGVTPLGASQPPKADGGRRGLACAIREPPFWRGRGRWRGPGASGSRNATWWWAWAW